MYHENQPALYTGLPKIFFYIQHLNQVTKNPIKCFLSKYSLTSWRDTLTAEQSVMPRKKGFILTLQKAARPGASS